VESENTTDPETGEPSRFWVTRVYDPVTFFVKFFAYEIDGLEGKYNFFGFHDFGLL